MSGPFRTVLETYRSFERESRRPADRYERRASRDAKVAQGAFRQPASNAMRRTASSRVNRPIC